MQTPKTYRRRVSSEEAGENYILILKNWLHFFPSPEKSFILKSPTASRRLKVESYRCICRGPEEPHKHYFIQWMNLTKGAQVSIEYESTSTYRISFN